jgi:hypothetical protein
MTGLSTAIAALQLPVLAGALFSGAQAADLCRSLPGILTTDLHLAGIALVILVPALPVSFATGLLLAAAWWAPALIGAGGERRWLTLLDASAGLRSGAVLQALVPGACLALAALAARSAEARPSSA